MKQTKTKLAIFEGRKIRRHWDKRQEKWYFSVVDIIAVLTNQPDHKKAQSYWTTLKNRLRKEGSEVVTKCDQLKMQASDGKYYLTDVADTETVLRLIQSIPSPNAEPFKLWLARVGYERIEETEDSERAQRSKWLTYLQDKICGSARIMDRDIRYIERASLVQQQRYIIKLPIKYNRWLTSR